MFEVCFDERSVSRLALVWLPDKPASEHLADSRAANLLFSALGRGEQPAAKPKATPKPARRRRKAAPVQQH
jgi:hypothetical protein